MGVLQTVLLLGSSSPLVNPGQDPSRLPSGRIHRPGCPAEPCPGVPPARSAPCPRRPNCHPPARSRGHWHHFHAIALSQQDSQTSGSFLPSPQPPLPAPKTKSPAFQPDPTPSARPDPDAPIPYLPQLVGPVAHGGPSFPLPRAGARGPQDSKFGTPAPHSHSDTDTALRPHPEGPQSPHEPREAPSLAPSTVRRRSRSRGPPGFHSLEFPFLSPLPLPQPRPHPLWKIGTCARGRFSSLPERRLSEAAAP